jgi:hypothetical protein
MWHEVWDTIRSNADKILDNALGLLRDAFILVFGIHYRNHLLRRKNEAEELAAKHAANEEQIREFRNWMESEKRGTAQGNDSGEKAGQENGVDSHSDAYPRSRNRVRKP